jgi:hypothetical protein
MAGDNAHRANQLRHPELVSGPISRFARSKRWQTQPHRKISPMRVALVDQIDFPLPVPALQLLLAQDRQFHFAEHFKMNEAMHGVSRRKPRQHIIAMLPKPRDQVGCDTDVDRAVVLACKDVDARGPLVTHALEVAEKWVLKQVQDDDFCGAVP